MIDIAWSEFLLIALIALILIGPKELPAVLRNIGRWVGRARAFARDLSAQIDLENDSSLSTRDASPHRSQEKATPQNNESFVETETGPFGNTQP